MKLRFDLKRQHIEQLHKVLTLVSQIWSGVDRIYMYFDEESVIVYPEERRGFDRIYARVHIRRVHPQIPG